MNRQLGRRAPSCLDGWVAHVSTKWEARRQLALSAGATPPGLCLGDGVKIPWRQRISPILMAKHRCDFGLPPSAGTEMAKVGPQVSPWLLMSARFPGEGNAAFPMTNQGRNSGARVSVLVSEATDHELMRVSGYPDGLEVTGGCFALGGSTARRAVVPGR